MITFSKNRVILTDATVIIFILPLCSTIMLISATPPKKTVEKPSVVLSQIFLSLFFDLSSVKYFLIATVVR
jgi:hypothetical protein